MKEMWNERYSSDEFAYGKEPNDFLKAYFDRIPKGKVLCIADGEGRNGVFLAKQGFQVTSVDQSKTGLQKAAKLAKENGVDLNMIQADLASFEFGQNRWSGVVSIFAHLPPQLRASVHTKIQSAMKPEGVFLLEAYNSKQLSMPGVGGPPEAQKEMLMELNHVKQELGKMNFFQAAEVERQVNEGQFHQGLSSTIQIIAVK